MIKKMLRRVYAAFLAVITSALAWLLLLSAAGAGSVTGGVYVLLGAGWAMVCAGGFLLLAATIVFKGLTRG